jgi:hypothetical protein
MLSAVLLISGGLMRLQIGLFLLGYRIFQTQESFFLGIA